MGKDWSQQAAAHLADHGAAIALTLGGRLQVPDKVHIILSEGIGDLTVKVVDIVAGD